MQQQSSQNHWNRTNLVWIGLEILAVLAFLSFHFLLKYNINWNEADVLPLARHYTDPTWIPGDWYLNQPPGYRELFQTLFGRLIGSWGFLTGSIAGRLISYTLLASGLVLIARQLGLNLLFLLLALTLFFYPHYYRGFAAGIGLRQVGNINFIALLILMLAIGLMLAGKKLGVSLTFPLLLLAVSLFLIADNGAWMPEGLAAGEWLARSFEAKALAYGLVLLAIGLMLRGRYRLMALMLGLATSFHVLVGGYTFLTVLGWLVLRRKTRLTNLRELGLIFLLYLAGSAFAIKPVLEQLFAPAPAATLKSSYIYVFLAVPAHVSPLSWPSNWWVSLIAYLLILTISVGVIWLNRPKWELSEKYAARTGLFEFTLISMIPFMLGLAVAPFDSQGRFLQYYPFRLGDIMLPLNTCLLFACALQVSAPSKKARWALAVCCSLLLTWIVIPQFDSFQADMKSLSLFPSEQQGVDPEWKDFCNWVRSHTPKDALVVSPVQDFLNFTWLSERPTIAKKFLLPQNKAGIIDWYERLRDLSGEFRGVNVLRSFDKQLSDGYNRLTTAQAAAIMNKYQADYFVTGVQHRLDLPVAYRNQSYVLYKKPG
ncbi:MAG: hypothetical protein KME26_25640 [Oscillatoria princeps RMCB-10]|jgi:hypothetical protein|nr:hypothetical protein [Oscillatoria princeps RMCB-10]